MLRLPELSLRAGEIVAVVGPAGVGKTLLLRGIAGLEPATGRVAVDGQELSDRRPHERVRGGLGFVPQHGVEVGDLIVQEVLELPAGLRGRRMPWTRSGVPLPGRPWSMYDLCEYLPGLERVVEADLDGVAAWERLAVSVALALRSGPHAVLLDEPAAGLGDVSLDRLRTSLGRIAATGVALVVATRNLALARSLADHTRELVGGVVTPLGARPGPSTATGMR